MPGKERQISYPYFLLGTARTEQDIKPHNSASGHLAPSQLGRVDRRVRALEHRVMRPTKQQLRID
jgi:hypothetical protein